MNGVDVAESAPATVLITVSFRSADVLPSLLDSVAAATAEPVAVIIVDNAQEQGVAGLTAEHDGVYLASENRGYGAAVNAGARTLSPEVEWIVVVNPDVVFEPGSIDALREIARADETVGAVGPRVMDGSGAPYPSARAVPSLRVGIGHAIFGRLWPRNPWSRRYHGPSLDSASATDRRAVGWLSGACLLIRREAFDAIGGFDEDFFMYFEDVDLGARLADAGYRNVFEPGARVVHTGAHSTSGESARMLAEHHRSAQLFVDKRYRGKALAPLRSVIRAGLAFRSAVARRRST